MTFARQCPSSLENLDVLLRLLREFVDYAKAIEADVRVVRMIHDPLAERAVVELIQRFFVLPEVDSAEGVGFGIADPDLGKKAWCLGVVLEQASARCVPLVLCHAFEVEIDDLYEHAIHPISGTSRGLPSVCGSVGVGEGSAGESESSLDWVPLEHALKTAMALTVTIRRFMTAP